MKRMGVDASLVSWQIPRTFVDVVEELRRHHLQLWFRPGDGVPLPADHHVDLWFGCEVLSAEGRILASQGSSVNVWRLTAQYRQPDRYPIADDDVEGCQALTEDFFNLAAGSLFLMNM